MISQGHIRGHRALWLENDLLRVSVLPDKGADICEFVHKPSGVDCLYKTLPGLAPPGPQPPADVVENYEGGWQELFPNTWDACDYRGISLPLHGEVALLPWDFTVVADDHGLSAVRLEARTRLLPFSLTRIMRLRRGSAALEIEETAANLGERPLDFVWGHHLVLGGGFLEAGCRVHARASAIQVPGEARRPANARLAYGQRASWPLARGGAGEQIDLSLVPGPEARSHDVAFLTDLECGEAGVLNPRLGLQFRLVWDASVFGCIVLWQPYGGVDSPPWAGSYGLGLEPWTACSNLAGALRDGKALRLDSGAALATRLEAHFGSAD